MRCQYVRVSFLNNGWPLDMSNCFYVAVRHLKIKINVPSKISPIKIYSLFLQEFKLTTSTFKLMVENHNKRNEVVCSLNMSLSCKTLMKIPQLSPKQNKLKEI